MSSLPKQLTSIQIKAILCSLVLFCSLFCQVIYGQTSSQSRDAGQQKNAGTAQGSEDAALDAWESKRKYFIVVAASKTANADTDLSFAKVDGTNVSQTLRKLGYIQIASLPDKLATQNNVVASLKKIGELPDNSLVVVYYSGHGVTDPKGKDVWLQLYGQDTLSYGLGLSLSNLIDLARGKDYKGELAVIIDACYSGQGALSSALTLKDLGVNTTILTSSSELQESYPIDVDKTTMSAFTHFLLEGFTSDWDTADDNHDGIMQYEELRLYIKNKLIDLYRKGLIDGQMTPYIVSQQAEMIAAYDPVKVKNPKTLLREALSLSRALKNNPVGALQSNKTLSLPVPSPRAREIAKLIPNNADKYLLALKAIAEGRSNDARKLLEVAEKDKNADLAAIYQARAETEMYDGNIPDGIKWLEKALQVSPAENAELLEEAAMAMFIASDISRAEELMNKAYSIRQSSSNNPKDLLNGNMFFAIFNLMKGDFDKARFHLQQIQKVDAKYLDYQEENFDLFPTTMLGVLDIIQHKENDAEPKFKSVLATSQEKLSFENPIRVMCLSYLAGIYIRQGKNTQANLLIKQFASQWAKALREENVEQVLVYLPFAIILTKVQPPLSIDDIGLEMLCQRSKALFEKDANAKNPLVLTGLANLAMIYVVQKKYSEAELSLKAALNSLEKTTGPISFFSIVILNALGNVYVGTERYDEADRVFNQALAYTEKSLGGQSMLVLASIKGLTDTYNAQERYQEAENANKRAEAITQDIWGKDSPIFASALEDSAETFSAQEKFLDAERLLKQALAINEKFYGPNHEEVGDTQSKLARIYLKQEKFDDAALFFNKALAIYDINGGHADNLAAVLYNMGQLSEQRGQDSDAEAYFKRAIEVDEKTLGYEDPEVDTDLRALAGFYYRKNNLKDAITLYERSLSIREKTYGQEHPNVAISLTTLGAIYCDLKEYDKAEPLLMRAIRIWEKTQKPNIEEFNNSLFWAARINKEQGNLAAAETFAKRILAVDESAKQQQPARIARDLENLGLLYYVQGKYSEAKTAFLRSISIQETSKDIPPINIINSFIGLSLIYEEQNENKKAASFREHALDSILKSSKPDQDNTIKYLEHYASILVKVDRPAEASQLRNFAKTIKSRLDMNTIKQNP